MPGWVTHIRIAETLLNTGLALDARGFCVGSVAPDCNVENADWTEFTPSREITHWMTVKNDKTSARHDRFFDEYINGKNICSEQQLAFLAGYYVHLIADAEFMRFLHDESRIAAVFDRLAQDGCYGGRIEGMPKDYDTIRSLGREFRTRDIILLEDEYLWTHPDSIYFTILRRTTEFPDYIDYLPHGAIVRKIGVMTREPGDAPADRLLFLSREEYDGYIRRTCEIVKNLLGERMGYI